MSDKPMTWGEIATAFIAWCAGIEIINGAICGFRVLFGGRHPEDMLHVEIGFAFALVFAAAIIFLKTEQYRSIDKDSDSV